MTRAARPAIMRRMDAARDWRSTAASLAPALVAVGAELALLLDDGSASAAAIGLTVASGGALVRAAPPRADRGARRSRSRRRPGSWPAARRPPA